MAALGRLPVAGAPNRDQAGIEVEDRYPADPQFHQRKGHGHAFIEFSRRHGDFAIVSAAALLEEDGAGKITRASLTLGGIAPAPVRARDAERMLTGACASAELFREVGEGCRKLDAMEDVHVTAAYRRQLAAVLARRALEKAHERVARN